MNKRSIFGQSVNKGIVFFVLISSMFSACENDKPIKIGFMAGISGRVADLGIGGMDAVQLIIDEYNAKGGVEGRQLLLVIKDDQQNPEIARKVAKELISEKVVAVIGPMTSDMGMVVAPIFDENSLLNVSPTATTQQLSGIDDYFFRVTSTVLQNATLNANYQVKSGDMKSIAAVYDAGNNSFTENWLSYFKELFVVGGGKIINTVSFKTKENNSFSELVDKLLVPGIDGVLIIANSVDSALLCQQVRKANQHIKITIADWGATEQLLVLGGKAVEGGTIVQTFDRENSNPKYQAFRKIYFKRFGKEPGFPGVHSYDAANVVLTAIKHQKGGKV